MFPSNNSYNPVSYKDQVMFDKHFVNDVSPFSKDQFPSSYFEVPPTFVDPNDHDLGFFQYHNEQFMTHLPKHNPFPVHTTSNNTVAETQINMSVSNKTNSINILVDETAKKSYPETEQMPKKSVKKDRHSKIVTNQGLRDRRMRLSLDVARKFFSLQDMLGYDKASKTIEWLLTKSKVAIKELSRSLSQTKHNCSRVNKSVSPTSDCEVVSGIDDISNNDDQKIFKGKLSAGVCKEKRVRLTRKRTFHPLAKESRAKARERAREMASDKRRRSKSQQCPIPTLDELNQLRCSSPLETGEESGSHSHDMKSSLEVVAEIEEPSSHSLECQGPIDSIGDESFVFTSKLSPPSIFDYQHEIPISHGVNSSLTENWDMDAYRSQYSYRATNTMRPWTGNGQECTPSPFSLTFSDTRLQSQFADIQFNSMPWESYNNQSLCRP